MTGIVGPNGCGKSNLLEALRWVMGENSAEVDARRRDGRRHLRRHEQPAEPQHGGSRRSSSTTRRARRPRRTTSIEAIEISRRIEREMGSIYKINGRDVRARDVQLFFADISSGAHSPALVKQGQIGS